MVIKSTSIYSKEATELINALSKELEQITGNSGRNSFNNEDVDKERSVFAVCYMEDHAVGCGGLKELSKSQAEIKRVYSNPEYRGSGIGTAILQYLEAEAKKFGYKQVVVETRRVNEKAVSFYLKNGYRECAPYGKYVGRPEAICMMKELTT